MSYLPAVQHVPMVTHHILLKCEIETDDVSNAVGTKVAFPLLALNHMVLIYS